MQLLVITILLRARWNVRQVSADGGYGKEVSGQGGFVRGVFLLAQWSTGIWNVSYRNSQATNICTQV
jgi:hypothetical protein